jgi:hypothetical protein
VGKPVEFLGCSCIMYHHIRPGVEDSRQGPFSFLRPQHGLPPFNCGHDGRPLYHIAEACRRYAHW